MATTSIEIPHLPKGTLVKDWKKGFLAATALLTKEQKLSILPLYVNRSAGDQAWAYEAAKKETIEEALAELQARIDGTETIMVTSQKFFELSLPDADKSNRSAVSSFYFKVVESGEAAGVPKNLIVCKFLQNVAHGSKVFVKNKSKIVPEITNEDVNNIFEEVQEKLLEKPVASPKVKVEEVFHSSDVQSVSQMFSKLQEQIDDIKISIDHSNIVAISDCESSDMEECSDEDENPVLFYKNSKGKNQMYCTICNKTNHTKKFCNKRKCENCQGLGHDAEKCPSFKKKHTSKAYNSRKSA